MAIWDKIDNLVGIRKGNHVLYGGIQLAANNMLQGELIQIPLTKNIGRQKQANILIAGGVIRGIKIMSTNERSTYDSLFRIEIKEPRELQIFESEINPLGIAEETVDEILEEDDAFLSDPQVLEYSNRQTLRLDY